MAIRLDERASRHARSRERAAAARALEQAKRAEYEARRLAKQLPKGRARAWLELAADEAKAARRTAASERRAAPHRAARRAAAAVARLERASRMAGPRRGKGAPGLIASAEADDRAADRAKLVKLRHTQAKQSQKMAKAVMRNTIVAAAATPSDERGRAAAARPVRPRVSS